MTQQSSTPSTRQLFDLAWPLGLKTIMLHGIILIDAYLVSPLGEDALAAMGLAGAIGGLLLGVLFAFSTATQIRVAQAFGAAGPVARKTGFYCGLFINLASTALGIVLVLLLGDRILDAFAHSPAIAQEAKAYLAVFLIVVLAEAVGQCLSSHFNGCGNTKISFYSYLITLPINVVLSLVLIHGLVGFAALGVVGAAYGSAVAALARMLYLAAMLRSVDPEILQARGWSRGSFRGALGRHWAFSLPIAATFVSMTIGNQACVLIYAKMSLNHFAAMTLILPWVHVAGTFGMAWAQATGIAVAQSLGKQETETALDAFLRRAWRGALIAAAIVALAYLVLILSSEWIYSGLQPETTAALMTFLPTLLLLPFPKGSNAICGQTLRASGDTVYVMNVFVSGQWICKVPLTALFVLVWQLPVGWVFSILLLEEFFKFPPFHLRLLSGRWKRSQAFAD